MFSTNGVSAPVSITSPFGPAGACPLTTAAARTHTAIALKRTMPLLSTGDIMRRSWRSRVHQTWVRTFREYGTHNTRVRNLPFVLSAALVAALAGPASAQTRSPVGTCEGLGGQMVRAEGDLP